MRDTISHSITYSLQFARESFSTFILEQPFLFIIIGIFIIRSIIAQIIKNKLKNKYLSPYENQGNTENKEFHIKYYKKVHLVNIFGVILVGILLTTYFITKNQIVGTVFAVGIWAMVISFQTFLVSILMYFILMQDYSVGNYIKIPSLNIQGEILYIKPLYTGIEGKNDFGESIGEFYKIPNNQIWLNVISKIDLSQSTYTKTTLHIPYTHEKFQTWFNTTICQIEEFLNSFLPLRAASQVGHYRTFIGVRYKLGFDYDHHEDRTVIWIWFISRRNEAEAKKRQILCFIESLKTPA